MLLHTLDSKASLRRKTVQKKNRVTSLFRLRDALFERYYTRGVHIDTSTRALYVCPRVTNHERSPSPLLSLTIKKKEREKLVLYFFFNELLFKRIMRQDMARHMIVPQRRLPITILMAVKRLQSKRISLFGAAT